MKAKILLAAFKSLGAREENGCEKICRTLVAGRPERVDYVVLEMGPNSESQLLHALSSEPGGILLTHEDDSLRWHHFHIESQAFDLDQPHPSISWDWGRGLDAAQMPYLRKISSEFAPEAKAAVGAMRPIEVLANLATTEQQDPFWCNRAYYLALESGQPRKKPVLFVRVGTSGTEASKLTPLRRILDLMMEKTVEEPNHA